MKIHSILESMLFKDLDNVNIDPDRDDVGDLKDKLLPVIIKMAYKNLHSSKEAHEKKHGSASDDEDAYNFDFTEAALEEEVETVLGQLAGELKEFPSADLRDAIKRISVHFPERLQGKKK